MGYLRHRSAVEERLWSLAERQHWVVSHGQLVELGFHPQAIKHRVVTDRLQRIDVGVYSVGRPQLTRNGRWMAAVLSCGPGAVLSHSSAAALWDIARERGRVEVSAPKASPHRRSGVTAHRRLLLSKVEITTRDAIPVTSPARTLLDNAVRLGERGLDRAINEADKRDLVDPVTLRAALDLFRGQRGVAILRSALDRHSFVLTDSELERRFLPLARRAGLSAPQTQCMVNGYRVDFFWPELGLVVETDGLRYHRTPAQQSADRLRDQSHAANGLTPLRFTHAQVAYEPERVIITLRAVAHRLASTRRRAMP